MRDGERAFAGSCKEECRVPMDRMKLHAQSRSLNANEGMKCDENVIRYEIGPRRDLLPLSAASIDQSDGGMTNMRLHEGSEHIVSCRRQQWASRGSLERRAYGCEEVSLALTHAYPSFYQ